MLFFALSADLPSPPPAPPVHAAPAPASTIVPEAAVRHAEERPCPLGGFAPSGVPCPHPALWGLAEGSDVPGHTLGSTDAAYGRSLTNQLCAAKPWAC